MRSHQLALLGIVMVTPGGVLRAQELIVSDSAAQEILARARTIRCAFDSGVGFQYGTTTRPNTVPLLRPKPLQAWMYDNPELFDDIDRVQRTARAIYKAGVMVVTVLPGALVLPGDPETQEFAERLNRASGAAEGLSFLQQTPNGDPMLTTVFAKLAPGSHFELLAVITRHMHWFGGISVSQHYGRCKVLFS